MEILDANKKPIVTIVSDSTQLTSTKEEVEDMGLSMTFTYADTKLETEKGLNRFAWDLRQKGAWSPKKDRSFKNGPLVAPGSYTAKLTVGKETMEQLFEILVDPRLAEEGISTATIASQMEFQNKVIDLLSQANKFQADVEAELKKTKDTDKKERLENVLQQLKNDEGAYPKPVLVAQISYLSYIVGDADKEVGQDAKERYIDLAKQLETLKAQVTL